MADIPSPIAHYPMFLLFSLSVGTLLAADMLGLAGGRPGAALARLKGETAQEAAFFTSVLAALLSYSYYRTFQRFAEVVDALGDRLVSVELVQPLFHTSLHCTTYDGRDFYLHYFGGSKHRRAQYTVWVDLPARPKPFDAAHYKGSIEHLLDLSGEPTAEGAYRLTAHLSDQWFASETPDILKVLDAMEEIRRAK